MVDRFELLRSALHQLSLEPNDQRQELARTVVTDELALDLSDAVASLSHASEVAGVELAAELIEAVERLNQSLGAPPGDPFWDDAALDRHPIWAEARLVARSLLRNLPS
jgi:hypothetical protein